MENLAIVSIMVLLFSIVIGFISRINVGVLTIGLSLIICKIYGISEKELISGFSSSLFITMVGVSYLFSLLSNNNTLENLSMKIVSVFGNKKQVLPILIFLLGAFICAIGPGAIPSLAIMPIIAVPIAVSAGYNPVMFAIIAQCGVMGARMSSLTPEAQVVMEIMNKQGLTTDMMPIFLCHIITGALISVSAFFYYKGWKVEKVENGEVKKINFTKNQIISIIALLIMIISVVKFKINVGLSSFLIGSILSVFHISEEKKSIKSIPWNVILLVLGVGILMNIVKLSGGIDLMADVMSKIMTDSTASPIMALSASIMSFFSSGLGVVFPTLMPTAVPIVTKFTTVYAKELIAMVSIGGTFTGISPISTTGALILSAVKSDSKVGNKIRPNVLFTQLILWAFYTIILELVLSYFGIYKIFVK